MVSWRYVPASCPPHTGEVVADSQGYLFSAKRPSAEGHACRLLTRQAAPEAASVPTYA